MLSALQWPFEEQTVFLTAFERGSPRLPQPVYSENDLAAERAALEKLILDCGHDHPVADFLRRTAESCLLAARMLESIGTPEFGEIAQRLYGNPKSAIRQGSTTVLEAAEHFIEHTERLAASCHHEDADYCVTPTTVADAIRAESDRIFGAGEVAVVLDPTLSSKAAAGSARVRVRDATCFSQEDIAQLIEHELAVHTLTARNGRRQPHVRCLELGAPRTTATQEGLAVLAELVTGAMDLDRLRRIALRPKALQMALDGADFIQVFEYFVEAGQSPDESYQSTYRVFRGGDVRGGVVFPKDGVYLLGLLAVYCFLRKSLEEGRIDSLSHLFAGRMTLHDVLSLRPHFLDGTLLGPASLPRWAESSTRLAAYLAHAEFTHGIDLEDLSLPDVAAVVEPSHS